MAMKEKTALEPATCRYCKGGFVLANEYCSSPASSSVESGTNSSDAQHFHARLPFRLNSSSMLEAARAKVALYIFGRQLHSQMDRADVHLVDDLKSLMDRKWVWPRKSLIWRLTQSLADVVCSGMARPRPLRPRISVPYFQEGFFSEPGQQFVQRTFLECEAPRLLMRRGFSNMLKPGFPVRIAAFSRLEHLNTQLRMTVPS